MKNTVLITGCSSGIGEEAARAFLDDGWAVYATARSTDDLGDLEAAGARTAQLDVTSTEDVEGVLDALIAERGQLDCLVNNAAFGQMGPVEDVPVDKVRAEYDVNTFGPHRVMRAALPHMRDRQTGTIINVTSVTDRFPIAGLGHYSASKSALSSVSQTLRQEVRGHGIDVVLVEPTVVATDFYDRMREELVDVDHKPAYTDIYETLELLHTVKNGGPGIASPEAVAETMLEAANSDEPERRYSVGSTGKLWATVAAFVPEPWRTPIMQTAAPILRSTPAKKGLKWWFARHHRAE
ncbi:SDR family oxidoreductase (plasmid) [Haloferacaceae archaeon DSL9]